MFSGGDVGLLRESHLLSGSSVSSNTVCGQKQTGVKGVQVTWYWRSGGSLIPPNYTRDGSGCGQAGEYMLRGQGGRVQ